MVGFFGLGRGHSWWSGRGVRCEGGGGGCEGGGGVRCEGGWRVWAAGSDFRLKCSCKISDRDFC